MTASTARAGLARMYRSDWIIIGGLAILFAAAAFAWLLDIGALNLTPHGGGVVNQYQTLISGLLAVAAAVATVWFIRAEIHQAARIEEERRRLARDAARALLPLALDGVVGYARESGSALRRLLDADSPEPSVVLVPPDFRAPDLPADAIAKLENAIRTDPLLAVPVGDLISRFQVQNANLRGLRSEARRGRTMRRNILSYVLASAELYGRAQALLPFARRDTETPGTLSDDDIRSGLIGSGFYRGRYPDLEETLERRRGRRDGEDA